MLNCIIIWCNLKGNNTRKSKLQIYKYKHKHQWYTALTYLVAIFKVCNYVDGTGKTVFLVWSRDSPFRSTQNWRWNWRSKSALETHNIAMYALKCLNPEDVPYRDVLHAEMSWKARNVRPCGNTTTGQRIFLEIWILLVMLLRKYILSSNFCTSSIFMGGKKTH